MLDGGLATELEAMGEDLSDALWSARLLADDPDRIEAAHLAFYRAGARVATTASYQATFEGFAARGIGHDEATALLRRSVELAERGPGPCPRRGRRRPVVRRRVGRAVRGDARRRVRVPRPVRPLRGVARASSTGSASRSSRRRTPTSSRSRRSPRLEEAAALAGLLADLPGAAAWVSFTCADGARLRSGAPVEEAVAAVAGAPGVVAVGVNCTAPEHVPELIGRIRATTTLPVVAYPNSGEGWDAVARRWTGGAAGRVDGATAASLDRRGRDRGRRLLPGRPGPGGVHGGRAGGSDAVSGGRRLPRLDPRPGSSR